MEGYTFNLETGEKSYSKDLTVLDDPYWRTSPYMWSGGHGRRGARGASQGRREKKREAEGTGIDM